MTDNKIFIILFIILLTQTPLHSTHITISVSDGYVFRIYFVVINMYIDTIESIYTCIL